MAHQPRDDGGTWSCGVGASTWMPCAKHVHGRLSRILTRRGMEVEEKCGKIGEKLGHLWRIHDTVSLSRLVNCRGRVKTRGSRVGVPAGYGCGSGFSYPWTPPCTRTSV